MPQELLEQQLTEFAAGYLGGQMIAGQILSANEALILQDGIVCLDGKYACHEMIGRIQKEEIIKPNGKFD
ncbi:MAG: hypothetical protein IJX37_01670 [Oscillospiraceae bacterium]|nr:hypothetical protein [Oscillospiraceae bacterium]